MDYELANSLWDYNPLTGVFLWKVHGNTRARKGSVAGSIKSDGYTNVVYQRKAYKGHRLAWFMINGVWPDYQIDHIDGDRKNNRIANLRLATCAENHQNRKRPLSNTSGFLGVYRYKYGKWCARIRVYPERIYLGTFDTAKEASEAYKKAKLTMHSFNPLIRSC